MYHSNKTLQSIYSISPFWVQNSFFTIHGMIKSVQSKKVNSLIRRMISNKVFITKTELQKEQFDKIKKILVHSYNNVPYFKRLFDNNNINLTTINSLKDFKRIPITLKNDIVSNQSKFLSRNSPKFNPIKGNTGGTTGSSLKYYLDSEYYNWLKEVQFHSFLKRHDFIVGRDRHIVLRGTVLSPDKLKIDKMWREDSFRKILYFSSYHLTNEVMDLYYKKMVQWRPKFVRAYPSSIFFMAKYMIRKNLKYKLKGVFCSSESVLDSHRNAVENAFDCKIFDHYGHGEPGCYAAGQCVYGNYHIPSDDVYMELTDNGQIVETCLSNFSMPFIRYNIEDTADSINYGCKCGLGSPFFSKIYGRDDEKIITPSGRNIGRLDQIVIGTNIRKAQIVQNDIFELIIKIVKGNNFSFKDEEKLMKNVLSRVGSSISIKLEYVKDIPLTKSGKFRFVVSNITKK